MTARVLKSIFSYQKAEQIKVLISFIEIYNEQAFDLLDESQQEPFYNKGKNLWWIKSRAFNGFNETNVDQSI